MQGDLEMLRPYFPSWLKAPGVEFGLEVVTAGALGMSVLYWLFTLLFSG